MYSVFLGWLGLKLRIGLLAGRIGQKCSFTARRQLNRLWGVIECRRKIAGEGYMVEGFWIVQFEGVQGNGGGVVFFVKGRIFGGDSGFVYTGTYQTDERTISGLVKVRNFLPEVLSVFGVPGDYELRLKGTVAGKIIEGSASLVNREAMGIVVKLTKVGELPV